MTDIEAKISCLHQCYEKMTGIKLTHRGVCNPREEAWHRFIKAGFTVADLELVIIWLKRRIKAGVRNVECLKFTNLIFDTFRFEEELGMAKAESRNAKPPSSPKEKAVAQLRPSAAPDAPRANSDTAKPIGFYIEEMRKAANKTP